MPHEEKFETFCPRIMIIPSVLADSHKAQQFKPHFPCGSAGKESACSAGDLDSIPELGRSPGKRKGHPLQYSGLENPMDCMAYGVARVEHNWGTFTLTSFIVFLGSLQGSDPLLMFNTCSTSYHGSHSAWLMFPSTSLVCLSGKILSFSFFTAWNTGPYTNQGVQKYYLLIDASKSTATQKRIQKERFSKYHNYLALTK